MDLEHRALRVERVDANIADAVVLAVVGELDLSTITAFKAAVRAQLGSAGQVVLELSGLGFCDSTGLGALVGLHRIAEDRGIRLVVVAPRRQVSDVLHLSGIDQFLGIYPTLMAACAAYAPPR